MAKFKIQRATTPKKRAEIISKERKEQEMTKKQLEKQRKRSKTDAARKKEVMLAQMKANRVEKKLKKQEEIKANQVVERELRKKAKQAIDKELKKKATAARVGGMDPPKRRGRPPKNLAEAMVQADAAAAARGKKVISHASSQILQMLHNM